MRISASLLIAALAAALATSATAQGATQAAAPVRNRICQPCRLPAFGIVAPRHGVLLARSGTYGAGTAYVMLDLDRHLLARGFVSLPGQAAPAQWPMRAAYTITPDETASLVAILDRIWAEPNALPSTGATDVFWEAWLADGSVMRRERGPGNPPGLAEELEKRMLAILTHYDAATPHTIR